MSLIESLATTTATDPEDPPCVETEEGDVMESFAHLDFVFSSVQAAAQSGSGGAGSGAKGDAASTSTKGPKTYRRPPPYIVDARNHYNINNSGNNSVSSNYSNASILAVTIYFPFPST